MFAGENATELVLTNETKICNDDKITLSCTARNSTIIKWTSSFYEDQIQCHRDDPSRHNTSINNMDLDIFTNYTAVGLNRDSLLSCNLSFMASVLPVNQKISVTCMNVAVEVETTISFQIIGMCDIHVSG